jgi:class 3 adenylate cyclase/CheY-like chemotaxis protein
VTDGADTGQLTFVFTDIERSSALLKALGDGYPPVLAAHREIIRAAAKRHGGDEMECRADEFFLTFPVPGDAARFAAEAQLDLADHAWPTGANVRVRMGIHSGHAIMGPHGYVGLDVHRAARIANAAHGGQVLVSETAARMMPEVQTKPLGEFMLAGLSESESLFQLVIPGTGVGFPSPRGLTRAKRPRILVADDSVLLREGLALLVERAGWEVVGQAASADEVLTQVEAVEPDVVVLDIRMPPTWTDDGIRVAKAIRRTHPQVGVLVLSQYAEPRYADELLAEGRERVGYLLKDRVADVDGFAAALDRLLAGECVLDATLTTE